MVRKLMRWSIIFFVLLLVIGSAASAQETQRVVFSFVNGDSSVGSVVFFAYLPKGLRPINPTPNMSWNATSNTLSITLADLGPGQKIDIPVSIEGPAGNYIIQGQLTGQWTQLNQIFQTNVVEIRTQITKAASPLGVAAIAKDIGTPIVTTMSVAAGGVLVVNAASSSASFAANIVEVLRFIGLGFFRVRRPKPWGRVYNQLTQKPIKGAVVKIFETTFQKLKAEQLTDGEGRFGFLVAQGTYYITVHKRGFQEMKTDVITIKEGGGLDISVPLLSETGIIKKRGGIVGLLAKIFNFIGKVNLWILIVGGGVSLIIAIILPTTLNFVVLGIYILLGILKFALSRKTLKSFGQVLDKKTQQPLALAVVRIFDANENWLLNSQVTDDIGRFRFLVVPGEYYVTCARGGYQPFVSQPLQITTASLISWDITLES